MWRPCWYAAQGAFVQGLQLTAFIGAVVMIGLAIMTLVLLRRVRPGSEPQRSHIWTLLE